MSYSETELKELRAEYKDISSFRTKNIKKHADKFSEIKVTNSSWEFKTDYFSIWQYDQSNIYFNLIKTLANPVVVKANYNTFKRISNILTNLGGE